MDNDLKPTIKQFTDNAHPVIKDYLSSGDLDLDLAEITSGYNLNDGEFSNVEDIVVSILIGLTNPDDLISEIKNKTSLTEKISENLADEIQNTILIYLSENVENINQEKPSNNIGNSFEQIILNQAIAMQPAQDASLDSASMADGSTIQSDEKRGDNDEMRIETKNTLGNVPENLPIEEVQKDVHNYSGVDPYREPVE